MAEILTDAEILKLRAIIATQDQADAIAALQAQQQADLKAINDKARTDSQALIASFPQKVADLKVSLSQPAQVII